MSLHSSPTGFVDAGTALANIHGSIPGRSRNVFRRDIEQDIVDVTTKYGAADTVMNARQGQSPGELDWAIEPKPVLSLPQQVTIPLSIWEGVVEEIDNEGQQFYARLTCKSGEVDEHRVDLMISAVEPSDLDLLAIGAVFYLEQYQRNRRGGREQTQILRFRRCVTWTQRTLDWARSEAKVMDAELRPYLEPKDDDE